MKNGIRPLCLCALTVLSVFTASAQDNGGHAENERQNERRGENDGTSRSAILSLKKDQPQELAVNKLTANQRYSYQVKDSDSGTSLINGSFRTGRARTDSFIFTVTADSHLDGNTDAALYQRTLANVKADAPDFHIDLGDTFMTGKHESRENAAQQYRAQRIYFG